jgi:hypothetical protein
LASRAGFGFRLTVQLVDKLLDKHIYAEIADIFNEQELRPGDHLDRDEATPASPRCASRHPSSLDPEARWVSRRR